ncbi:Protein of unknown function DUF1645, plant [Dillenia turbinata]|uniref:Uncharacterized protein n=1 Tax=Dillenia turbinata TaxID=194707 RepID=A0AAN8UFM9_9MAGN
MQESNTVLDPCPSFSIYSSDKLSQVADKVVREHHQSAEYTEHSEFKTEQNQGDEYEEEDDGKDGDFEFILSSDFEEHNNILISSPIRPVFPIFSRDLVFNDSRKSDPVSSIRIPLKKLFIDDRDPPSCSSSEADELDNVPPGTYCVWTPKSVQSSPGRCNKSNSTGSCSKRWRFLDLLRRSNSDGKDSFVFLTPSNSFKKNKKDEKTEKKTKNEFAGKERSPSRGVSFVFLTPSNSFKKNKKDEKTEKKTKNEFAGKVRSPSRGVSGAGVRVSVSAHEDFYVKNKAMREGERRKSYLPYKKDLIGYGRSVTIHEDF